MKYTEVPYCTYLDDISLDELISLAKSGDSKAQFVLGTRYAKGSIVSQDLEKAEFWYSQCLGSGDQEILCHLAYIYHNGDGVNADINKCMEIMSSYRNSYLSSSYDDDINYRRGCIALHNDKDQDNAIKLFELASSNGRLHLGAAFKLAQIYLKDNERHEEGIHILLSILNGGVGRPGECSVLALVKVYLDNKMKGIREDINENLIAPALDDVLGHYFMSFESAVNHALKFDIT